MGWLKKKFDNPHDAAAHYMQTSTTIAQADNFCDYQVQSGVHDCQVVDKSVQVKVKMESKALQVKTKEIDRAVQTEITIPISDVVDECVELQVLSLKYASLCHERFGLEVPSDYLIYSGAAMVHLASNKRSNVLYSLAKGLGTLRKDKKDSLFPVQRMPMGLVEYAANFYIAGDVNQVQVLYFTVVSSHRS